MQQDGNLGQWRHIGTYPIKIDLHVAAVVNNHLYVFGGFDGAANGTHKNVRNVYYAPILPDKTLGGWSAAPALPLAVRRHAIAVHNDTVYISGGYLDNKAGSSSIFWAKINKDGQMSAWQSGMPLPKAIYYHASVVHDDRLLILGGQIEPGVYIADVQSTGLNPEGGLSTWRFEAALPKPLYRFAAVNINRYGSDYVIVLGGLSNQIVQSSVYHSTLPNTPTPTPSPTPTFTPSPTPKLNLSLSHKPEAWIAPGEKVTYVINYATEDEEFRRVKIRGEIPEGVELIPESISSSPSHPFDYTGISAGETVTWDLGDLPPHFSGHLSYEVKRPTILSTQLDSVLEIRARGPSAVPINSPIQYTLTITNNSIISFSELFVRSRVPSGARYISGGEGLSMDHDVYWTIAHIHPKQTHDLTFTVTANRSVILSDYSMHVLSGRPTLKGRSIVITYVGNTRLLTRGDGFSVINPGTVATWLGDQKMEIRRSNVVSNPSFEVMLPLMLR
ncbi:hypothetical protein KFU94_33670 [Chloroflexi bacterium TSY]|nr:hypothetical protein [Chloroflexi bacterium TSY]